MQRFWKSRFVVAEPGYRRPHPETGSMVACGWCPWYGRDVLVEMLKHHANYISLGVEPRQWSEFTSRHEDLIRLGRRHVGYRLAMRSVRYPASVTPAAALPVETLWSNFGVGRLHHRARLHAYLLDADERVVWEAEDGCEGPKISAIVHGEAFEPEADRQGSARIFEGASCFQLDVSVEPGTYTLSLGLREAKRGRAIRLAQEGAAADLHYRIGPLVVQARR